MFEGSNLENAQNRVILAHELTHALIVYDFPDVPTWFNEGLGSLHEGCRIERTRIVGVPNWRLGPFQKAIREKKQVSFRYAADKGAHPVSMEPYRVVYYGGFWYLIGNEPATGILKRYALDRITDFRLSKTCFKGIPDDLDAILHGSANIWFAGEMNLEVTVLIDAQVSHYFKRRTMFPTQEIKEERPDGSLVVTFRMGQYEAIRDMLKSWIPNIVILAPEEFRKDLLEDVKRWVKRQEGKVTLV
jgi:predicted DNA-binding transcriptional regulator YafY